MPHLSFNIDHVATVRQARYRDFPPDVGEPDPVRAAHEAELGGADGVTVHLREDRRHIVDRDVHLLRQLVKVKFNLEMAATEEMIGVALDVRPHTVMLVPEGREEVTTEGGLDVAGQLVRLKEVVKRLKGAGDGAERERAGGLASAFIDAEDHQVDAAREAGFDICEVHTGPYAAAFYQHGGDFRQPELAAELQRVAIAGRRILAAGMRFNAGHALNYHNVAPIASLGGIAELHIGHAIVSRAVYVGLRRAVAEMKQAMRAGHIETDAEAVRHGSPS